MHHRYRPFFLAALAASCTISAKAQNAEVKKFRSDVISNVLDKVKTKHFAPRALDDQWSAAVWASYIRQLDPNNSIFLREDVERLTAQQLLLDDQLNAAQTTFFDSVYTIYRQRMQETKALCEQILAGRFDYNQPESFILSATQRGYPADKKTKEQLWRKLLKHQVLRNYMDLQTAAGDTLATLTAPDPATETKARDRVRKWYTDQFRLASNARAEDEKFAQYIAAAMIEIDPHTVYSGPTDKSLQQQITTRYFGLGMELSEKETDYFVKRLLPGGTAARSGAVKENDQILSISDGKGQLIPVSGLTAGEVTGMIRGEKDTEVKLMLRQPGDTARTVALKRGEVIDLENRAKSAVMEKNGKKFGYLYLPLFYLDPSGYNINGASNDVALEVEKLKEQEVEGIIVDLRGNGGGSLDEVVRMSSTFMESGPVTWLRTQTHVNRYNGPANPPAYDGPLVVMVDENSASASEIFAAVIQDRRRGLVVGPSSTYGKGTAQMTLNIGKMGNAALGTKDISYGSLRLTTQKFYRVTGTSTQLNGVKPDIIFSEKMQPEAQRERSFSSSLPCDTLEFPAYDMAGTSFGYDRVVEQARKQVAANPAFSAVTENMEAMKQHATSAVPLQFLEYRKHYSETARFEKNIRNAKTLPAAKALTVELPVSRSIRPDLRKDEQGAGNTKEWLKAISQDVYIDASLSFLENMASTPVTEKK